MTKVLVTKDKLDTLAEIVGGKSDTEVPLTLDEMIIAADSITSGYIIPTLETVTKTYTPSTSAITDTITPSAGYDGIEEVGIIISAIPTGSRGAPYWMKSTASTKYILQATFPNVTAGYISSIPAISTTLSLENKVVEPTESQQTIAPTDLGCYLNSVTINAIPSNYVGSGIPQRSSSDLTASGATVTAPSGYYASSATKTVPTVNRHSATIDGTGTSSTCYVQYNSIKYYDEDTFNFAVGETITIVAEQIAVDGEIVSSSSYNYTLPDSDIYIEMSTDGVAYIEVTELMIPLPTTSLAVVNPSTSTQTVFPEDYNADYFYGVTVNAMPSGTAGTPTATKGAVNNHAISVTPSVTNTAGYISGGTKTGTAVSVSASELVSGTKSIIANGTGIDVTNYESVDVAVMPTLETVTKTYAPSTSAITETITPSNGYDGIGEVDVTVNAVATGSYGNWSDTHSKDSTYFNTRFSFPNFTAGYFSTAPSGNSLLILEDETVTPSTTSQIVTPRGNSYYLNSVTIEAMPSGTAGTPTATKGTVSNHSVSITPSVTNTTGYITGGTKAGTSVTVSASELVSGTLSVTQNGTADVTNYASVDVNVSGGGGGLTIGTATKTLTASASSISFTGLSGNPTSFVITSSADQSTGGTKAVAVAYDGTNLFGMDITTQMENDTGFTKSYSSGTLTVTATSATFEANEYKLVYTYGGSSSDIHTADVQVGSGATSITFSGLSGRPAYFSCVFKSTFSTSSGYQRVIDVVNDGTNTYGNAMDSSAKALTSWSYSYSSGSLTITSTGTNNGGYFHQPGYYQLTYAMDSSAPQYESISKTYRASTSAQSETITPSSGYDAIEEVSVSIPAVTQTNLTADNIKSGTTVTISNGQSNLWSVTGTYSGGGGSSMNTQTVQSTSRRNSTSLGSITSLTCSKAGTYDIYWTCTRSNTSQTWGSQLYINNSAYGTENTTWSNNVQNNKLTGVTLSANQTVAVYGRSRNGYYIYAPQLTIVQTA